MTTNNERLRRPDRRQAILDAALLAAGRVGYIQMTRDDVAAEARVSPGLVQHHFPTVTELKNETVQEAIRVECLPVLAQAVGTMHDDALDIRGDLFDKVLAYIRERGRRE